MALIDKLSAIASAIREKTGSTDSMTLEEMASAIRGISDGNSNSKELESLITRRIETIYSTATRIGASAFDSCEYLTTADLPFAEHIGYYAFNCCYSLTSVNCPVAKAIEEAAFSCCESLRTVTFPKVEKIWAYAFEECTSLEKADFPSAEEIFLKAFVDCTSLKALILRNTEIVCELSLINAFSGTPVEDGTGYIYVPSALIESYKVATNWSNYATQFRALEDYTVDGTVTGELDMSKI